MQRWEYYTLRLDTPDHSDEYLARYLNGQEIREWEKGKYPLLSLLSQIGEDGWELVGIYEKFNIFVLRRPKAAV